MEENLFLGPVGVGWPWRQEGQPEGQPEGQNLGTVGQGGAQGPERGTQGKLHPWMTVALVSTDHAWVLSALDTAGSLPGSAAYQLCDPRQVTSLSEPQ